MVNEDDYETAFAIISYAGNAKSSAMLAIKASREGDFARARELLRDADKELHSAHNKQTQMLTEEARGNPVKVNIILVHAQDHLSGAILVRDLADEFLEIHERLLAMASPAVAR